MTPAQQSAFNASVGGFFTAGELYGVIAAITLTLAFTWLAWLAVSAYGGVARRSLDFGAVAALILRGTFVLMLLGYFIR